MKKIFLFVIFLLFFSFYTTYWDYIPTDKDRQLINSLEPKIKEFSKEKLQEINTKIPTIMPSLNVNSRNYFLVNEIYNLISKRLKELDKPTPTVEEKKEEIKTETKVENKDSIQTKANTEIDEKLKKLNNKALSEKELMTLTKTEQDFSKLSVSDKEYIKKESKKFIEMTEQELKEAEYDFWNKLLEFSWDKTSKEYIILNYLYESILKQKIYHHVNVYVDNIKKDEYFYFWDSIRWCYYLDNILSVRYTLINDCSGLKLKNIDHSYWFHDSGFDDFSGKMVWREYFYDKDKHECYSKSKDWIKNYVNPDRYCKTNIENLKRIKSNKDNLRETNRENIRKAYDRDIEEQKRKLEQIKQEEEKIKETNEKIDKEIEKTIKNSWHIYRIWPKWWCYYINSSWKKSYVDHYYCR